MGERARPGAVLSGSAHEVVEVWDAAARRWPDRPALSTADGPVLTYADLWARAGRHRDALRAAGAGPGQRVLVEVARRPDSLAHLVGVLRSGATAVPVAEGLEPDTLARRLAAADASLVLRGDGSLDRPLGAGGGPASGPGADPPVWLIFTSGSTADPRAVVSPGRAVRFVAEAIVDRLGYRGDDVVLSLLPLTFDYGLYQSLLCALVGAHLVLAEPTEAVRLPALARRVEASVLPLVPSAAAAVVARRGQAERVRLVTTTGERVPVGLVDRLAEAFPSAEVRLMYGTTECKRISIQTRHAALCPPGSSGPPLRGTRVRVHPVAGADRRGWGEVLVAGPHLMDGYWGDPGATAAAYVDHDGETWLHTGDLGWLDEDGEIHVEGRMDDLLKIKGVRTSATEIESAALRVPGVVESALLVTEREPVLVVAGQRLDPASVHAALIGQLGHEGAPARCLVLAHLPHTAHGKVDRARLMEELAP